MSISDLKSITDICAYKKITLKRMKEDFDAFSKDLCNSGSKNEANNDTESADVANHMTDNNAGNNSTGNKTKNISFSDLSNYIKKEIKSMSEENAEWVKVRLQRKKESAATLKNMILSIFVPLSIFLYTMIISSKSDEGIDVIFIPSILVFLGVAVIMGRSVIIASNKEESYRELYDLTEKAIQETYSHQPIKNTFQIKRTKLQIRQDQISVTPMVSLPPSAEPNKAFAEGACAPTKPEPPQPQIQTKELAELRQKPNAAENLKTRTLNEV